MPGYEDNIYYYPEKCGLEVVGELEYSSGNYEFDTRVVWFHAASGRLLTARDSGCSCPTPFEECTIESVEDISSRFGSFLMDEYRAEVKDYDWRAAYVNREEVDSLIAKCAAKFAVADAAPTL